MILCGDLSGNQPTGVQQFLDRMTTGCFFARLMTKQDIDDLIAGKLKVNDKYAFEVFIVSIAIVSIAGENRLYIELLIDRAPDGVKPGNHRLEFDTSDCTNLPDSFFIDEEIPIDVP
ncbi:MAG: hypothetical protein EXS49_01665 [Candidatus Pacebacteria bacterium]|nr:hypothetical protein [Candidatus Paceibacterota bacterium]